MDASSTIALKNPTPSPNQIPHMTFHNNIKKVPVNKKQLPDTEQLAIKFNRNSSKKKKTHKNY